MEKTQEHEHISLNMEISKVNLITSRDKQNGAIDNTTKLIKKASLYNGKKRQRIMSEMKKNVQILQIDIKLILNNVPCTLHFDKQKSTKNINNLQENVQDTVTTNNQIDKTFTFQPASVTDNSDVSVFPYIENASSIGSEDSTFRYYNDLPVFYDLHRDLKHPYRCMSNYELNRMKYSLIDTYKINALHVMMEYRMPSFIPYCFLCLKRIHVKSEGNVSRKLICHIKSCSERTNSRTYEDEMLRDEKRSSKEDRQISISQLAREYITAPANILTERLRICPSRRQSEFNRYTCLLCCEGNHIEKTDYETEIEDDFKSLYNHITSEVHQTFKYKLEEIKEVQEIMIKLHEAFSTNKWQRYRCEICNYENSSEIQFMEHLNHSSHVTQLVTIPENEREKIDYYVCYACLLLWFGHKKTFEQHGDQNEHKDKMLYYPYIEYMPKDCIDLLTYIKQNRQLIVTESNLVLQNTRNAITLLHSLKRDLLSVFPNIKMYPFGSRISGLALPNSDVDVFLDCEYTYSGRIIYARSQELIKLIESQLSSLEETWKIEKVILTCRTPIIRVSYIPSKLSCDIAVTSGLGVEKTKMIKRFIEAFPMCRELILFVKRWLQMSNQSGSNFITSYALAWLVIFYLQYLDIFPSISDLIELKNNSRRISGWEIGVSHDFSVKQTDRNFEELLFGFFRYYSKFDYKNDIVCPLLGEVLQKSTYWNHIDMKELRPYIDYIKRPIDRHTEKKPERFLITALCVQDPFDLSHNITNGMNTYKLEKFRKACKYATRLLKKTLTGITSKIIERYSNVIWHRPQNIDSD